MYSVERLRTCRDDCRRCPFIDQEDTPWSEVLREVCSGECVSNFVCPFLMTCRCLNPRQQDSIGNRLERIATAASVAGNLPVPVPANLVRLWEGNVRRRSEEDVLEIREAISKRGLLSFPLGIASRRTWSIEVVAGVTRYLAIAGLGWPQIPIRVIHVWDLNDLDLLLCAFQENIIRREMSWREQVEVVRTIWERTGHPSVRILAKMLGKSPTWTFRRLAASREPEPEPEPGEGTGSFESRRKPKEFAAVAADRFIRINLGPEEIDDVLARMGFDPGDETYLGLAHALVRARRRRSSDFRVWIRRDQAECLARILDVSEADFGTDADLVQGIYRALRGNNGIADAGGNAGGNITVGQGVNEETGIRGRRITPI